MDRGIILENIAKLNTFVTMSKTNDFLRNYVEKILNKKCKSIKFNTSFDCLSMELLYSSLELNTNKGPLTDIDYKKIDKKELKYHFDKTKGIRYFSTQVRALKNEETVINYIKKALEEGAYVCNYNNTVRFDNGLIVDSMWLIEFLRFFIESLNINTFLSDDSKTYIYRVVEISKEDKFDNFIKNIKIYDYSVNKKSRGILSFQNIKYLKDNINDIKEYDFDLLKDINGKLSKEGYTLSVNKHYPSFSKTQKENIKNMLNEEHYESLDNYIKDILESSDSPNIMNRQKNINIYETLKSLSHAYKNNYKLSECREKIGLYSTEDMLCALVLADFYINYIYDENNLNGFFNYELLRIDKIVPDKIDYETIEYKRIINSLSNLNKRLVGENRKINKSLARHNKKNSKSSIEESCLEIDKIINEIQELRKKLEQEKNINLSKSNINERKIKYIKESIVSGNYKYDGKVITFDVVNSKYFSTFHLEIPFDDFVSIVLSDYNKNLRINYYQI